MKQFLDLSCETLIEFKFIENKITTSEGTKIDYVDDAKKIANGKHHVNNVFLLIPDYGQDGYSTGKLNKVFISRIDILAIAEAIRKIEEPNTTGIPSDDLPF